MNPRRSDLFISQENARPVHTSFQSSVIKARRGGTYPTQRLLQPPLLLGLERHMNHRLDG